MSVQQLVVVVVVQALICRNALGAGACVCVCAHIITHIHTHFQAITCEYHRELRCVFGNARMPDSDVCLCIASIVLSLTFHVCKNDVGVPHQRHSVYMDCVMIV
jgi:hypothetical protein